jgi:hypothetical protein
MTMTWTEVCARRLERHALSAPAQDAQPADIVDAMCGAHAQVMSAAELSLGIRIAGVTRAKIQDALWAEHSLIKTFGPRGTIHLLPARDLAIWAGALSALPYHPSVNRTSGLLMPEQAEAIVEAIAIVLSEAELTTDELTEALVGQLGAWAGEPVMPAFQGMWPRWRIAQGTAGARGAFCFGPNRGRNVTYTNPRRWLPGFEPADSQASLMEIVRRYLHAYGPATPQQFAQWLGAPRRLTAELFDSLSGELQQVELNGASAWLWAGDIEAPATPPQEVRLLPYFDPYTVGCHPRELLFPGRAAQRALAGSQAGNFPVLLIDGTVAGVWHQRRSGRKIEITVEPLDPLTRAQRDELGDQVERIGEFFEGKPLLTIGAVKVGAHA